MPDILEGAKTKEEALEKRRQLKREHKCSCLVKNYYGTYNIFACNVISCFDMRPFSQGGRVRGDKKQGEKQEK